MKEKYKQIFLIIKVKYLQQNNSNLVIYKNANDDANPSSPNKVYPMNDSLV